MPRASTASALTSATANGATSANAHRPHEIVTLSLAESAAATIAQEIASGILRPGERLPPERELAQRLGLGRGALREAFRTLESAGLLTAHVGRGRFVADAGSDGPSLALQTWMQLQPSGDLMAVRRILEPAALRDMPATQVRASAQRTRELLRQMQTAHGRGATSQVVRLHTDFHLVLVRFGSSRLLRSLATTMISASARWQGDILRDPVAARHWFVRHERIVEALESGDVEDTAARVAEHMQPQFVFDPEDEV